MSEKSKQPTGVKAVAEGVWTLTYPLPLLGQDHGRVVTVLALSTGKLIIHSTAPFSTQDVASIEQLGTPCWLVEANLQHDTFAKEGFDAFPALTYLGPEGFAEKVDLPVQPLFPPPSEWENEVDVVQIEGIPTFKECVLFHRRSRTLVVGDLLFNFDEDETTWEYLMHHYAMGLKGHPDVNRVFAAMVRDRPAFDASIQRVMEFDFERVIVGHKEIVTNEAKERSKQGFQRHFPGIQL